MDANFRFGFLNLNAYGVKTFSPESVVPGSGEDFAARGSVNYQSRPLAAARALQRDRPALQRRDGVRAAPGRGQPVAVWRLGDAPAVGVEDRDPRDSAALAARRVQTAGRPRPGVALPGLASAVQFSRRRVHRDRRQPQRRGDPPAVHDQQRPRRPGGPGPLRLQRVVLSVAIERRRAVLVGSALLDRRLLRRLPARLHVRAEPVASASTSTRR